MDIFLALLVLAVGFLLCSAGKLMRTEDAAWTLGRKPGAPVARGEEIA